MFLEILKTAFFRALWQGLLAAGLAYFTAAQAGVEPQTALITAAVVLLSFLSTRAGAEGIYDGNRQRTGEVHNADVGSTLTTVTATTPISASPVVITQPTAPPAA